MYLARRIHDLHVIFGFSSGRSSLVVPGIGTIQGFWVSSHAIAIWVSERASLATVNEELLEMDERENASTSLPH